MPSKPKIAIVHDLLLKLGGAENLLKQLLKLFPQAEIFTLLYDEKETKSAFENHPIHTSCLQKNKKVAPRNFKLLLPKFPQAVEKFDLSGYDLVISHSNSFAHGVITTPKTLHLCYCLSPTRYLYDWKDEYLAENNLLRGLKSSVVKKILSDIRVWDTEASVRPDRYLAISEHVRQRIRKYYRLDSSVIYPAVDLDQFDLNQDKREEYYVIISRLSPYKKVDLAVNAFNESGKSLLVVGTGEDEKRLRKLARPNIEFLGWQSDRSRGEYLRNARALIFPGEEDFGLTPVEAMACGTPVVAFKRGGVTETVRDGQDGIFFDQPTSESLNSTLDRFEQLPDFDPNSLRRRAENFNFEHFKEAFIGVIDQYYGKTG